MYKRECLEGLTLYKGMHRFFPTLVRMRGFKVIEVPITHHARLTGETKYGFGRPQGTRVFKALVDLLAVAGGTPMAAVMFASLFILALLFQRFIPAT